MQVTDTTSNKHIPHKIEEKTSALTFSIEAGHTYRIGDK